MKKERFILISILFICLYYIPYNIYCQYNIIFFCKTKEIYVTAHRSFGKQRVESGACL